MPKTGWGRRKQGWLNWWVLYWDWLKNKPPIRLQVGRPLISPLINHIKYSILGNLVIDFLSEKRREEVLAAYRTLGTYSEGEWRELHDGEVEQYRWILSAQQWLFPILNFLCTGDFWGTVQLSAELSGARVKSNSWICVTFAGWLNYTDEITMICWIFVD